MKHWMVMLAAIVGLCGCTDGAPINALELDPVLETIVSANDIECTTADQLITSQMVSGECLIRLNRQAYPRVNVKAERCTDMDTNEPENSHNGVDWVVKVRGDGVMIQPLTHKALTLVVVVNSQNDATKEGVYFTGEDGVLCN